MLKIIIFTLFVTANCSLIGGTGNRREQNLTDPAVYDKMKKFALVGLREIELKRSGVSTEANATQPKVSLSLLKIVSAQSQIVSGVNYFIDILMKTNDCDASCTNEQCSLVIWDRPWLNETILTNFNCKKQSQIGGMQKISVKDARALKALDFAVSKLNKHYSYPNYYKPSVVNAIYRQVVRGVKYTYNFKYAATNCEKHENLSMLTANDCTIDSNAHTLNCKLTVVDQPWVSESSRYDLSDWNCY